MDNRPEITQSNENRPPAADISGKADRLSERAAAPKEGAARLATMAGRGTLPALLRPLLMASYRAEDCPASSRT
jgi:hypothetical protein